MYKVQHFDLPVDNPERAKKFYKDVLHWQVSPMPAGDMEYWGLYTTEIDDKRMPKEAGAINGGFFKRNTKDDMLTIYATVDSIDQTLKESTRHGGKTVMPKMPVGDMGYMAKIKDPEGNLIGLWEAMMK